MKKIAAVALAFGACLSSSPADEKIYVASTDTERILSEEGRKVVVHGETGGSTKSSSGTNFVGFDEAEFQLVTFKSDLDQFEEGEPHEIYDGKRVAVEGTVSVYRDRPQIKLTSPAQVTLLERDEPFPPKPVVKDDREPKPDEEEAATEKSDEKSEPEPEKRKPPVDPSEFFK
ncbi:MAG: hypothetical protein WD342_13555 [Verrucomicrobiales bacterium]